MIKKIFTAQLGCAISELVPKSQRILHDHSLEIFNKIQ
ncbi:hypothetical protein LEP1GSC100_1680 [Leptospira interrogans serovar Bataviae str. UI 08561]|nr:hypothetical protein LEP1GSC100_1680 [Leptospira interrogans serovar Bataviae str. UI 08561]